jgi:hypothetical protein
MVNENKTVYGVGWLVNKKRRMKQAWCNVMYCLGVSGRSEASHNFCQDSLSLGLNLKAGITPSPSTGSRRYTLVSENWLLRLYWECWASRRVATETHGRLGHGLIWYAQIFYSHVTVHRNRFPFNNQRDALFIEIYSLIKLYTFLETSLPIIRNILLYTRHW